MFYLSLSGGLDSTALCALLAHEHGADRIRPVFFLYGSKHNPWEHEAARKVADHYSLKLSEIDLSGIFSHVSSKLLSHDTGAIPTGEYDQEGMKHTLVPGRNLIFAAALASLAESCGGGSVCLATHGGDHHLYPDCRPAFNQALCATLRESSEGKVRLLTPFAGISKAEIVRQGLGAHAPFHLTRSCYQNERYSCGQCGTCRERLEAFAANNLADPISYRQ